MPRCVRNDTFLATTVWGRQGCRAALAMTLVGVGRFRAIFGACFVVIRWRCVGGPCGWFQGCRNSRSYYWCAPIQNQVMSSCAKMPRARYASPMRTEQTWFRRPNLVPEADAFEVQAWVTGVGLKQDAGVFGRAIALRTVARVIPAKPDIQ